MNPYESSPSTTGATDTDGEAAQGYPASAVPGTSQGITDTDMGERAVSGQETGATGGVIDQVQQAAGHLVAQGKQVVEQVVEGTRQAAGGATDRATDAVKGKLLEQAVSALLGQKDDTALVLAEAARALQQTGAQLRSQDRSDVARATDGAAAQLERLSGYLRAHTAEDIADDAERIAARVPAGLLTGALVLGLLAGRLLDKPEE